MSKGFGRLAACTAVVLLGALASPPAAAQPVQSQLIVVQAPRADSPVGTLTAYEMVGRDWQQILGPIPADLGELGVGEPQDDVFRTPVGTFPLGMAFGREPNPGTALPYTRVDDQDWWDEDVDSPTYNTLVRSPTIPSEDAENLGRSGVMYDYAVLVDHNPARIPGRSAGIFLHVSDGEPTWGCIAVARDDMRTLLQWLDPAASPRITIGVGEQVPPTG
ncbi:L,D-transpeptidase [Mycolicibacterium bacteremicum]|uniref:L,D-transpeptidase family protein n=1 Tax=Mycolicibacterium bacteremicum TaxID=564198 RepID=UPI0026EBD3AC|nr:L,D-transpeptidase family protein [Mycolicibacterium bacteremicum]